MMLGALEAPAPDAANDAPCLCTYWMTSAVPRRHSAGLGAAETAQR
jgi:hypothetical protein